ncbi:hypothetical protein LTR47_004902 [Exophiala xenobiotica]|nr:hypothetical protein LTR47_004902 [Exophiala xenobiotica]KAK5258529.1 hypothetical protein LTR40_007735 [Exophiala xenobiotica]KAK5351830.1 hypothetical protein LTR61_005180 [Exophiala xenobiotica]KAK5380300.1 hypothetical protein LTR11_003929 [Exophiala xenobiotica]KAK5390636.1 hypothetical protein LTS03_000006 [Exophiala xenobiotica]
MAFGTQTTLVDSFNRQKSSDEAIVIQICETESITAGTDSEPETKDFENISSSFSSLEHQPSYQRLPNNPLERDVYQPPNARLLKKLAEGLRLAYTRGKVTWEQRDHDEQPISAAGRFNHSYVYPLDNRKGKNERIVLGRWAPKLQIRDGNGTQQTVIQAASHNYAGFYNLTQGAEDVQHLAMRSLPVANSYAVPSLESAMHDGMAQFFSADFCYTTSTGYGSNLLAFSAILNHEWLVMFDDKCHNSMHVAAFLSHPGLVKKFPHGNFDKMEAILSEYRDKYANVLVAIEGFYSMDGTVPALDILSRMKHKYNFTLLADEAHSLMCLGSTGRGCIEVWNEQNSHAPVPSDLFDLRTGTLSKSVGSIGGIVSGRAQFADAVFKRRDEMLASGADPLPTSSVIQTLNVLGQPSLLQRQLRRLTAIAIFVREELHRAGIFVYGNAISPILPVYAGRPSMAAKMSYALRKVGLLATPVSTPAVPFWESRVRICLSADHDNDTVDGLVAAIVEAAQNIALISNNKFEPRSFSYPEEVSNAQEESESRDAAEQIRNLIQEDINIKSNSNRTTHDQSVITAGHEARQRYGLGSGGARWITGTSDLHIRVERLVAQLTGTPEALTYPDSFIGLMSTTAALSRPVTGFKRHVFLVANSAPQAVWDGLRVAPRNGAAEIQPYSGVDSLLRGLESIARTTYVTLFLDSSLGTGNKRMNLPSLLEEIRRSRGPSGMTVLLHDDAGASSLWHDGSPLSLNSKSSLGFRDHQLLVTGSFYHAFGLPGAYLAGSAVILKELRYTSRGYMFSTSQQPFIMGMVAAELEGMMNMR